MTDTQKHFAASLMGTGEAAALLGVHPTTVFRWIERGLLDAVYLGNRYFVSRDDLAPLKKYARTGVFSRNSTP